MILGTGIDIIEISRIQKAIERWGEDFLKHVFTPQEIAFAQKYKFPYAHYAGRFAAKEAVIKAVSQIDPGRTLAMHQVEIRNDRLGRPHIILHDGRRDRLKVHVSLSHVETVAVSSAIAIR